MTSVEPIIELDAPIPTRFIVGQGQYQVLRGTVRWKKHVIRRIVLNSPEVSQCSIELFPADSAHSQAFIIRILWLPENVGEHHSLSIMVFDTENTHKKIDLGSVELISDHAREVADAVVIGDQPLITICMATYSPAPLQFARQLESIICQHYENWLLIVCDDASQSSNWRPIKALCESDPRRIRLYRHDQNLGFYHNFERALGYVPDNTEYVVFSDQDDIWYPDKLQKLVNKLEDEQSQLVYSDMRIVHESGKVIAETYWLGRKNEYKDFDTVFLANTVTGAASLFRHELLETLLPFPEKIGDAFHDHWLACCALARGEMAYVDEALYDYMQYGGSVIGHCDFVRWTFMQRMKSLLGFFLRFLNPRQAKQWLGQKIGGGMAIYRGECLRLQLIADTLKARLPNRAQNTTLNLMNGGWMSALKLVRAHLKIIASGRTTDDAEFRLAMGFLAREYQKKRSPK